MGGSIGEDKAKPISLSRESRKHRPGHVHLDEDRYFDVRGNEYEPYPELILVAIHGETGVSEGYEHIEMALLVWSMTWRTNENIVR
jgi:hypothetical protein